MFKERGEIAVNVVIINEGLYQFLWINTVTDDYYIQLYNSSQYECRNIVFAPDDLWCVSTNQGLLRFKADLPTESGLAWFKQVVQNKHSATFKLLSSWN